ncbi:uncharacterized protein LOC123320356 [Coccinella septempunctata]|uniref:uncharacterized protein LOC123320356 n=1 Tax=Coccinella septempunctata TaxID=41139 RepID=UPI001D08BE07|nr:uncharacterized protein LOC123320356 [Coccinella septempunctata]
MIMDSSSVNDEILRVINVNARVLRREAKLSLESEDTELIGFMDGKMVFKKNIVDKSIKTQENIDNLNENMKKHNEESLKKNEASMKPVNTQVIKEVKIQNFVQEPHGKKFIYLNGKKLQIVRHTANTIQNKLEDKIEMPKLIPKLRGLKTMSLGNKSGGEIEKNQPSVVEYTNQQAVNFSSKQPRNILPKLTGKIISINKTDSFQNLSMIMKEMGGTIRLVSSQEPSPPGIPLINKSISENRDQGHTVKVARASKMELSQSIPKENKNSVTVSTNTEQVKTAHKGVQTEISPKKLNTSSEVAANPISELYSSGVIIGDDVNMGHGPPSIYTLNEQHIKMKFFNDLNRCLKWESGNLPIHRGVIQQDLQEVRSQCVVLKVRKKGINIANINNYTPLQLAVINNVSVDIVKVLLEYNADLSVLDSEGNNVLHLAVEHNRTDLVRIFLDQLESSKLDINCFNYDGLTPLMMCAFHVDRIDMAEQLLKKDALLNLKDLKSGRTAIFHAAESHNAPMVLLLLDYGADTKIRNFFGTSVHDAMFELDDMPKEIKYPILGRDLKVHEKRKLHQQKVRSQETFKRKKLEIVSTIQKLESKSSFVVNTATVKK